MTISAVSKSRVAYVAETSFTTTPSTPTFREVRRTAGNLSTKKTTVESEEIHLFRRTPAVYQTGQDVAGSYDLEFSYGTLEDFMAYALQSAWASDVISDASTQQSITVEETVDTGGSTFAYSRFTGCEVNSLALTMASRAAIKGSVSIMGQVEALDTGIVTGATYTNVNTNQIETAVGISGLSLFGLSPVPKIKSLSLTIDNSLRIRDRIGFLYSEEFGSGLCKISGSMEAYFESNALYAQSLAHGLGAISFGIGTVTSKKYTISIPNAQITDGSRRLGGRNDDVMVTIPFEAVGTVSSALITITRAVT